MDISQPEMEAEEPLRVDSTAAAGVEAEEDRGRIRAVLESMPDGLRIPLVLCDVDGLAYQEIADALGLGLSATKMRIARGREMFRRRYAAPAAAEEPAGAATGSGGSR